MCPCRAVEKNEQSLVTVCTSCKMLQSDHNTEDHKQQVTVTVLSLSFFLAIIFISLFTQQWAINKVTVNLLLRFSVMLIMTFIYNRILLSTRVESLYSPGHNNILYCSKTFGRTNHKRAPTLNKINNKYCRVEMHLKSPDFSHKPQELSVTFNILLKSFFLFIRTKWHTDWTDLYSTYYYLVFVRCVNNNQ